ncbi:MAG TPA: rRNA maturation RNase YbeY [Gemmatimonadales bacterium]|nr:rRNA maturation RNase YbeY [Gemmatimonadales bacterium]
MPRIRTAESARRGGGAQGRENVVAISGRSHPLPRRSVARAALAVLSDQENPVLLSIAFVSRERMRTLNRRWKGKGTPTDVLAFPLAGPGGVVAGDVYVCPWVAARNAHRLGVPVRQELTRLVIHGVLHVLGYDHPEGAGRTASPMWRRQERYLRGLR